MQIRRLLVLLACVACGASHADTLISYQKLTELLSEAQHDVFGNQVENKRQSVTDWAAFKSTIADPMVREASYSLLIDHLLREGPSPGGFAVLDDLTRYEDQLRVPHPESERATLPALRVAGRAAALQRHWQTLKRAEAYNASDLAAVKTALAGELGDLDQQAALRSLADLDKGGLAVLKDWLIAELPRRPELGAAGAGVLRHRYDASLAQVVVEHAPAYEAKTGLALMVAHGDLMTIAPMALKRPGLDGLTVAALGGALDDAGAWLLLTELLSDVRLGGDAALAMARRDPATALAYVQDNVRTGSDVEKRRMVLLLRLLESASADRLLAELVDDGVVSGQLATEALR